MQQFLDEVSKENSLVTKLNLIQKGFTKFQDDQLLEYISGILNFDIDLVAKVSYELITNLLKYKRIVKIRNVKELTPESTPGDFLDETLNKKSEKILTQVVMKLPEFCLAETLIYIISKQDTSKITKVDCGRLLRTVLERKDGLNSILHFIQDERLFFVNLIVKKDEKFIKNIISQILDLKIDYNLTLVIERLIELNPEVTEKNLLEPTIYRLLNRSEWSDEEMKSILKNIKRYYGSVKIKNQEVLLILFKIASYLYNEEAKQLIYFHFDEFEFTKNEFSFELEDQFIHKVKGMNLDKEYSLYIQMIKNKKNESLNRMFLLQFKDEKNKIIESFRDELMEGSLKEYHLIIKDVNDEKIPIQSYGISMLCKYMLKNDYNFDKNISLIESKLESEDSYLFLTCIKGLSKLGLKYPTKVIPMIIQSFEKSSEKLKLLEIIMDTMALLGEALLKYINYFIEFFLKNLVKNNDNDVKASILSNISTLCDGLKMGALPWVQYFVHSSKNILLSSKEDIMVKRASMHVISSIIQNQIYDKEQIVEIVKLLKILQYEKDNIIKQSAKNLLDEILEMIKLQFPGYE